MGAGVAGWVTRVAPGVCDQQELQRCVAEAYQFVIGTGSAVHFDSEGNKSSPPAGQRPAADEPVAQLAAAERLVVHATSGSDFDIHHP